MALNPLNISSLEQLEGIEGVKIPGNAFFEVAELLVAVGGVKPRVVFVVWYYAA